VILKRIKPTEQIAEEALHRAFAGGGGGGGGITQLTGPVTAGPGSGSQATHVILPTSTETVWVAKGGSDITGTGSVLQPYASISHALSSITDASSTKLYTILVQPGVYTENVALKPDITVEGVGVPLGETTQINGNITLAASALTTSDICGIKSILVTGTSTFTDAGKNYLFQVAAEDVFFSDTVTVDFGFAFLATLCFFSGSSGTALTAQDIADSITTWVCQFTALAQMTVSATAPGDANWDDTGSEFFGDVTLIATSADTLTMDTTGLVLGDLTLDGGNALFEGIPAVTVVLSGGATLAQIEYFVAANGIGYTPSTPAKWAGPAPLTVQSALDRLAAAVEGLLGHPIP